MEEELSSITLDEYYQCIGLLTAGRQEAKRTDSLNDAFIGILGEKAEDWFWDMRYGDESLIKTFSEWCKNHNVNIKRRIKK